MKVSSLTRSWIIWVIVAFGLLNIYSAPDPGLDDIEPRGAAARQTSIGDRLLTMLRVDGDTRRYFAYANAILGRPYDGYFVRSTPNLTRLDDSEHKLVHPERGLTPWRDFVVEYPPGMLVAALLPALIVTDFTSYHSVFGLLMEATLTLAVWLNVRSAERIAPGAGETTLMMSILFVAALGVIGVRRYDPVVTLTIAMAIRGLTSRRPILAGVGLAAGVVVKVTPLLLAPFGAVLLIRRRGWAELRAATIAGGVALLIAIAGYLAIAGPRAADILSYHADRPLQIESPYAAALMVASFFDRDLVHVVASYGSDNIMSAWEPTLRPLGAILPVVAILAIFAWFWRAAGRARDEASAQRALMAACTAALIAFMGLGKVFSPQYMIWLLPTGAIAAALSTERSRVLLVASAMMTQIEFPFIYRMDTGWIEPSIGATALVRDALLLGCAISLLWDASRDAAITPQTRREPIAIEGL